jgi:uncharacterized protein (TIGR02231 family)
MRTGVVCFLCCAIVLVSGLALAGEDAAQEVESKISQVTVYSDRALVRRVATLTVHPGEYEFVFAGLPRWLDDDSLRASGAGSAAARLLGIESKVVYTKETPEERVQALRDEIQALEDKIQVVTDELDVLGEQRDFVTQMKLHAQQAAAQQFQFKEVDTEEWSRIVNYVGTTLDELMQSAREKNIELRELKKDLEIKQKELGELKRERVVETKQVTVSVEALGDGTLELALDYVVRGAAWRPLYDARADVNAGTVELTYYGTVSQKTGEDWTDVKLVLSTAQPAIGAQVPELSPWYLDSGWRQMEKAKDKVGGAYRGAREGVTFATETAGVEVEELADGAAEPLVLAERAIALVAERGTSAVFEIKKTETIPSDNEPHRTTIGIVKLDGEMRYTIVPKIRPTAFLETTVTNTSELHLLTGPVHVFLGPDFIGRARIDGVAPTEEFELSLGPDERVKVERETLKDRTNVSKTRNKVVVRNTIEVTVENYTGKTASFVVEDQIPVSQDADVKVKLLEATDRIEADKATGELTWEFELGPGASKELTFEFDFSFPKEAFDYYRRTQRYQLAFQ